MRAAALAVPEWLKSASMTELVVAVDSRDPATGLAAVAALRRLMDELEALQVSNARAQSWTWEASRRGHRALIDREDLPWGCSPAAPAHRSAFSCGAASTPAGSGPS